MNLYLVFLYIFLSLHNYVIKKSRGSFLYHCVSYIMSFFLVNVSNLMNACLSKTNLTTLFLFPSQDSFEYLFQRNQRIKFYPKLNPKKEIKHFASYDFHVLNMYTFDIFKMESFNFHDSLLSQVSAISPLSVDIT